MLICKPVFATIQGEFQYIGILVSTMEGKEVQVDLPKNFKEFEAAVIKVASDLVTDAPYDDYRLESQLKKRNIYVSDPVIEIVERALENYRNSTTGTWRIDWNLRAIGETDGYCHFYRSFTNAERLAALSLDKLLSRRIIPTIDEFVLQNPHRLHIAIRCIIEDGWFRWMMKENFSIFPGKEFLRKHGTLLKTGKVLRLLSPRIPEKKDWSREIEVLSGYVADELRGDSADSSGVEVSDIPSEVYTLPYREPKDVANSCMRGKERERFAFYDDMENCRIIFVKDGRYCIGRALLWDNVRVESMNRKSEGVSTDYPEGSTIRIMDRVFARDRHVLASLTKWARDNNYFVKRYPDRSSCHEYVHPTTGEIHWFNRISVPTGFELTENSYTEIPYLDTFCFAVEGDDRLYTWNGDLDAATLQNQEGEGDFLTGHRQNICDCCGYRYLVDDLHEGPDGNLYCDGCFDDKFEVCSRCGEVCDREDARRVGKWDDTLCPDCAEEVAVQCTCCGNWFFDNDVSLVGDDYLCDDCFTEHEDEIAPCSTCGTLWYEENLRPLMVKTKQLSLWGDKPQFVRDHNTLVCPDCEKVEVEKVA